VPDRPTMRLTGTVLDTPDPRGLARFYAALLDWPIGTDDQEWATLRPGGPGLSFQLEEDHVPPVWPQGAGTQQMQAHLDIQVDDLDAEVARAVKLGATVDAHQPQEGVRVMRDPDGHLFCLYLPGH
jgi:catechol 2,3-dioxygenase-like lactoylglutathione lyase family enzyme